jgi:predicted RNA-binding Zn ribbon-like protein
MTPVNRSASRRRRQPLAAAEFQIVGGAVCLDFVNTTGARASVSPRERLRRYDDLLIWSVRVGILNGAAATRLRAAAAARAAEAGTVLRRVRTFRESLYPLLCSVAERTEPSLRDVALLDRWVRAERRRQVLTGGPSGFEIQHRVEAGELDGMLWPIVSSAVDLLTSPRRAAIKRCGECDWLFLDETKNGSRTWCKKACGDRVRARRHYERIRGERGVPHPADDRRVKKGPPMKAGGGRR